MVGWELHGRRFSWGTGDPAPTGATIRVAGAGEMLVTQGRTCLLAPPCRAWSVAAIRLCSAVGLMLTLKALSWHRLSAGPHSSVWPGPQAGLCPAQATGAGPEQARGLPGDGVLGPRDVQGMERLGQGLARSASASQPAASPGAAGGSHTSPASPRSCLGPRGVCRALFADGVRLACAPPAELALAVRTLHAEAAAPLPRREFTIPPSLSVRLKSAALNAWASISRVFGLESHPTRLFLQGAGSWALCVTSRKAPGGLWLGLQLTPALRAEEGRTALAPGLHWWDSDQGPGLPHAAISRCRSAGVLCQWSWRNKQV